MYKYVCAHIYVLVVLRMCVVFVCTHLYVFVALLLLTQIHVLRHVYIVHMHTQPTLAAAAAAVAGLPYALLLAFSLPFISRTLFIATHRRFRMIKCTLCAQINFLFTQIHFLSVGIFESRRVFFASFFFHRFSNGVGGVFWAHTTKTTHINHLCLSSTFCAWWQWGARARAFRLQARIAFKLSTRYFNFFRSLLSPFILFIYLFFRCLLRLYYPAQMIILSRTCAYGCPVFFLCHSQVFNLLVVVVVVWLPFCVKCFAFANPNYNKNKNKNKNNRSSSHSGSGTNNTENVKEREEKFINIM